MKRKKLCVFRWVYFDKEIDFEKYYCELFMFFIYWCKGDEDFFKLFNLFEESFKFVKG